MLVTEPRVPVGTRLREGRVVEEVRWKPTSPTPDLLQACSSQHRYCRTKIWSGFKCQLLGSLTSDQGTGTAWSQYHWQRFLLRYILCRCRGTLAITGGASWNGPDEGALCAPLPHPRTGLVRPLANGLLEEPHCGLGGGLGFGAGGEGARVSRSGDELAGSSPHAWIKRRTGGVGWVAARWGDRKSVV